MSGPLRYITLEIGYIFPIYIRWHIHSIFQFSWAFPLLLRNFVSWPFLIIPNLRVCKKGKGYFCNICISTPFQVQQILCAGYMISKHAVIPFWISFLEWFNCWRLLGEAFSFLISIIFFQVPMSLKKYFIRSSNLLYLLETLCVLHCLVSGKVF